MERGVDIASRQVTTVPGLASGLAGEKRGQCRRAARLTTSPCSFQAKRIAPSTSSSLTATARASRLSRIIERNRRPLAGFGARRTRVGGASAATGTISPSASERRMSSQPSGSARTMSASGQASAIPGRQTAAPHGNEDERRRLLACLGELIEDFEPDRALPGDDRRSAKLGTTVALSLRQCERQSLRGSHSPGRRR